MGIVELRLFVCYHFNKFETSMRNANIELIRLQIEI